MNYLIETDRLILRDLLPTDDEGMFELDSDPEVHRYVGKNPVKGQRTAFHIQLVSQIAYELGFEHPQSLISFSGTKPSCRLTSSALLFTKTQGLLCCCPIRQ